MHSLDWLRGEMIARGCTKAQAEGIVVAVAYDILTNSGGKITELQKEERETTEKLTRLQKEYHRLQREVDFARAKLDKDEQRLKAWEAELKAREAELEKCESAAERDKMRKAHFFLNSFRVGSKDDNTAKINGLAAILSSNTRESQDEEDDAS